MENSRAFRTLSHSHAAPSAWSLPVRFVQARVQITRRDAVEDHGDRDLEEQKNRQSPRQRIKRVPNLAVRPRILLRRELISGGAPQHTRSIRQRASDSEELRGVRDGSMPDLATSGRRRTPSALPDRTSSMTDPSVPERLWWAVRKSKLAPDKPIRWRIRTRDLAFLRPNDRAPDRGWYP